MNQFEQVYEITLELRDLLEQDISPKNREEVIKQLNELIQQRGKWMEKIEPPFSEEENRSVAEIYSMNETIQQKMEHIFADLKMEMRQVQKQKKKNDFYTNPYKDVQYFDGTFLDSKK